MYNGDAESAIERFKIALDLAPNDSLAFNSMVGIGCAHFGAGNYVESDRPDPVSVYGKTMAEGEEVVRSADAGAALLRISLPMGVSFNGHAGAIDWIQSRFKKGRPATLYFDEIRTPAYTDCLNRLYERVLAGDNLRAESFVEV